MKKSIKIILLVTALLTIAFVITAVTMLKAVSGDALLYMNSKLGSFYAHSYRWFCLASIVMVLFWAILVIAKRKAIAGSFAKRKEKNQERKKENISSKVQNGGEGTSSPKVQDGTKEVASQKQLDEAGRSSASKGQGIGKEDARREKKGRFCENCGKQIAGNDKFCGFCGGLVKAYDEPEEAPVSETESEPESETE